MREPIILLPITFAALECLGKLLIKQIGEVMTATQIVTVNETAGFTLTPEWLQQIGVKAGDQIEIAVNERSLTVRSLERHEIAEKMDQIVESLMERRRGLYERLAEGPK